MVSMALISLWRLLKDGSLTGTKGLVALLVMLRSWSIMASSSPPSIMSSVIWGIGAGGCRTGPLHIWG